MPARRTTTALAAGLTTLVATVAAGCSAPEEVPDPPEASQTALSTPLASVDTTDIAVARGPFCEAVREAAVELALGGLPVDAEAWQDGEEVPGLGQLGHEYGCRYVAEDGAQARAWVFAPPVSPKRARGLAGSAAGPKCERVRNAEAFGRPSVTSWCTLNTGASYAVVAGLFGDAWLSCSVDAEAARAELLERTGSWCVEVARAASSA